MVRPWFICCLRSKLESSRMAPKEKQKIEIEKTHRDPLLSFNQAVTVDCSDFLGTALKKSVDSRPTRSTRKWSRTAHPATRNISGPERSKLLYKSSGPDTASAQRSRSTRCVSR